MNVMASNRTYLDLRDIKERITAARIKAAHLVNRELIRLYWDIGHSLVEKQKEQGWGKSVVRQLALDLSREFGKISSFSARNLWFMRQFYLEYSGNLFTDNVKQPASLSGTEKMKQLVSQIPWGHNILILQKVSTPEARLFYLKSTAKFGWSRNVLLNQIKANAFERAYKNKKTHNFPAVLPEYLADQADEALKSSYNLEFLGIHREIKERELEARLLDRLRDFILELGYGFCFIGRQYRLVISAQEYFIDLLFYHRFLKSLVAIELKIGPFKPEYAGKMDFYLNILNETEKASDDNPAIGIILCAEKDDLVVEFSLKSKTNPIGVSEYQLTNKLPGEFDGKLPSANELCAAVRIEMEMNK
jgi:predicted nuclease of restriction endonuclease-like (RecB) superfamily